MQEMQNSVLTSVLADIESETPVTSKRRHVRQQAENLILYVAPVRIAGDMPSYASFFPVRCRDLSSGGVGFFMPAKPSFKMLVVQLGSHHKAIYMEATVRHTGIAPALPEKQQAWDANGKEFYIELGSSPFVVGCQFLERLDATPW